MPKYTPVELGVNLQSGKSELLAFELAEPGMMGKGFHACFVLPNLKGQMLSVTFEADAIIRILDEFPLSTELEKTENEGLVHNTFAYTVTGSQFEEAQSGVWREVRGPITHYRFLTGNMCLDVLVRQNAQFSVVSMPANLLRFIE